jgi:hypothetical protein
VNAPAALALIVISRASPATPATPSPFDDDPAASDATNVPWPTVSVTSRVLSIALYVSGRFASMSGALRSAPESTIAIGTATDMRRTSSGTRSDFVEAYCHWYEPPGTDAGATPGSTSGRRATGAWTNSIPRWAPTSAANDAASPEGRTAIV